MAVFGYALFYWGYHHFTGTRYSLWTLLGITHMQSGQPLQLGGTTTSSTTTTGTTGQVA